MTTSKKQYSGLESARISMTSESGMIAGAGSCGMDSGQSLPDRYDQLLKCLYDAVLISDMSGMIVGANPRASDFLLYESSEFLTRRVPDVIANLDEHFEHIKANLASRRYCVIDAKCVRKDDSRFPAEIAVSLMGTGEADGKSRLCFFIRDITVRKQAEKALKGALEKLERQDRAKALLISNVSHELRTPLTSLLYGISTLMHGGGGALTDKQREYIERFYRECRRLLGTVEDILDLERIETHTLKLSRVSMPAARLLEKSAAVLDLMSRHKGIEVRIAVPAQSGFINCDPAKMERVFVNLIGNSIKYTPAGGSVVVTAGPHPSRYGSILMVVEDTGIGIPSHALEKVATRYFRVGEQGDGSGLGLSIAKEITDAHGGSLEIQSPPSGKNRGTAVSVIMPTVDPPEIILAGGENSGIGSIFERLGSYGYRLVMCRSGVELFIRLKERQPDAGVILFPLPEMEFSQFAGEMRNLGHEKARVMIVMANTLMDAARKEIAESMGMTMLQADASATAILDSIDEILARRNDGVSE